MSVLIGIVSYSTNQPFVRLWELQHNSTPRPLCVYVVCIGFSRQAGEEEVGETPLNLVKNLEVIYFKC